MKKHTAFLGMAAFCATTLLSPSVFAGDISPQRLADMLFNVIKAHRTTYSKLIVNRLDNEEGVIKATEHWEDEQTLLLPAQMFRAASELVQKEDMGVSYSLISPWPLNSQNAAKTKAEKAGFEFIAKNPGKNYYAEETLEGKKYFTAMYPDIAVTPACVTCHNEHRDTPRRDFKLGDMMGAVMIRIDFGVFK